MQFDFEQITATTTTQKLAKGVGDSPDYALYSVSGGDIYISYSDRVPEQVTPNISVSSTSAKLNLIPSREGIQKFRVLKKSGTPILDIQYFDLEWTNYRRFRVPKVKVNGLSRKVDHRTSKVSLGTGTTQYNRVLARPRHTFLYHTITLKGDKGDKEMYALFNWHLGDKPFYLNADRFSTIKIPRTIGYGDGTKTNYFLPNKFIMPNTIQIYINGIKTTAFDLDTASGLIVFHFAPTADAPITASYSNYYKVVFGNQGMAEKLIENQSDLIERTFAAEETN